MTELIDLTKILKVGDKVWDIICGEYETITSINANYILMGSRTRSIYGQFHQTNKYPESDCTIFPSQTQRDWQKYIDDKAEEQKRADLLEKAKKDYPIGTVISKNPKYIVTGIPFLDNHPNASVSVLCNKFYERYLYFAETWAPIITKEKLFTTDDGVDAFKGEVGFAVIEKADCSLAVFKEEYTDGYIDTECPVYKWFSTKEAAEKFIAEEKSRRLLEEARLKYPIGTKFRAVSFPDNCEVSINLSIIQKQIRLLMELAVMFTAVANGHLSSLPHIQRVNQVLLLPSKRIGLKIKLI